tara:strand:+ start:454 stop:888 length:435 start_codon:yes stop_codon:yes gene_type:complete
MIECALRDLKEFHSVIPSWNSHKTKKGLYSGSNFFSIKGFGREKWVIVVHIDIDYESYLGEGLTKKEIVNECVEFLNQPLPRKKYAKKTPKPLYGVLSTHKSFFKKDEQGTYIEAYLITDQRKNKNFWREGTKFKKKKKRRKKD